MQRYVLYHIWHLELYHIVTDCILPYIINFITSNIIVFCCIATYCICEDFSSCVPATNHFPPVHELLLIAGLMLEQCITLVITADSPWVISVISVFWKESNNRWIFCNIFPSYFCEHFWFFFFVELPPLPLWNRWLAHLGICNHLWSHLSFFNVCTLSSWIMSLSHPGTGILQPSSGLTLKEGKHTVKIFPLLDL